MSIIKRKKQDKFFIMSNHATQKDLTSLSSIGLLAYIISLPEDWILYKTYLQNKFTRRTVDSAWKELVQKDYIAGFVVYVGKEKKYFYIASDEKLNQYEFDNFVEDTLEELIQDGLKVSCNIKPIPECNFTTEHFVQYIKDSTPSTVQEVHIQMKQENKDIEQKHTNKETSSVNTNTQSYIEAIHSLFLRHGEGLFTKDDIFYFTEQILKEVRIEPTNPEAYFYGVVDMIIYRRKKKLGLIEPPKTEIYNWLEA